jgi:hypothetical protein
MTNLVRGLGDRVASLQLDAQSYVGTAVRMTVPAAIGCCVTSAALSHPLDFVGGFVQALPYGSVVGLLIGLFLAFSLKGGTATLEVGDKKAFISRVNIATWRLGYKPAIRTEDSFIYRPSFALGTSGWRISVEVLDNRAVIYGPKQYVEKVIKAIAEA